MDNKRIYEFNLENLSIRHFLFLNKFRAKNNDPQAMEDFIKMGGEFCDFDPLELPFSEFQNFTEQFSVALAIAFRLPDSSTEDN